MTVIGGDDNEDVDAVALRFLLIVATLMAETWFDGKSCMLVFGDENEDAVDERVFMATSMALTWRRLRPIEAQYCWLLSCGTCNVDDLVFFVCLIGNSYFTLYVNYYTLIYSPCNLL